MDLKQLLYFVTIVEEGNITAASKRLHVSQPPLSNQLKLLEEDLGVKLLERGSRKVTLTDSGKVLLKKAYNILELAKSTRKELYDLNNGLEGTLSLGTVSSSGYALLSSRMIKFHKGFPKVTFKLHEGNTYELIELLNAGIIEVAIVRTPFSKENLNFMYLEEEPMIAVMKKGTAFYKDEEIKMGDLEGKPLIIYRRFENLITSLCNKSGFEPNILCINDDARTSLMWANSGLGIAIIPKSALKLSPSEDLIYSTIKERELYTKISAIWVKDRYLSSIAERFLSVFREEL